MDASRRSGAKEARSHAGSARGPERLIERRGGGHQPSKRCSLKTSRVSDRTRTYRRSQPACYDASRKLFAAGISSSGAQKTPCCWWRRRVSVRQIRIPDDDYPSRPFIVLHLHRTWIDWKDMPEEKPEGNRLKILYRKHQSNRLRSQSEALKMRSGQAASWSPRKDLLLAKCTTSHAFFANADASSPLLSSPLLRPSNEIYNFN